MFDILLSALARIIIGLTIKRFHKNIPDILLEKKTQWSAENILRVKFRPQDFVKPTN